MISFKYFKLAFWNNLLVEIVLMFSGKIETTKFDKKYITYQTV